MSYNNVLYSRVGAKRIPANSTGVVRNVTDHLGGDGSGGSAVIDNADVAGTLV